VDSEGGLHGSDKRAVNIKIAEESSRLVRTFRRALEVKQQVATAIDERSAERDGHGGLRAVQFTAIYRCDSSRIDFCLL